MFRRYTAEESAFLETEFSKKFQVCIRDLFSKVRCAKTLETTRELVKQYNDLVAEHNSKCPIDKLKQRPIRESNDRRAFTSFMNRFTENDLEVYFSDL